MRIATSSRGLPSATKIALEGNNVEIVRSDYQEVLVNWGRARANSKLNPDISNVTNKKRMRELFKYYDVPMPKLLDNNDIAHIIFRGGTVVGRPDNHTKGRGFWKCSTLEQVRKAYRGTRKKKPATHFMEYISRDRAPREYRVHIFNGKSIRISQKDFQNDGSYITRKPQHEVSHVREAAKKAVKAVGLDFGAVDILANDIECWVTEVNSAPGLGGSMPRLYLEAFKKYERSQL